MRRLRLPLLILILAALGAYSAAQAPPAGAGQSGAGQSGATDSGSQSGAASEELPAFQPSEQVSADVAVAFPVDI